MESTGPVKQERSSKQRHPQGVSRMMGPCSSPHGNYELPTAGMEGTGHRTNLPTDKGLGQVGTGGTADRDKVRGLSLSLKNTSDLIFTLKSKKFHLKKIKKSIGQK